MDSGAALSVRTDGEAPPHGVHPLQGSSLCSVCGGTARASILKERPRYLTHLHLHLTRTDPHPLRCCLQLLPSQGPVQRNWATMTFEDFRLQVRKDSRITPDQVASRLTTWISKQDKRVRARTKPAPSPWPGLVCVLGPAIAVAGFFHTPANLSNVQVGWSPGCPLVARVPPSWALRQ